MPIQLAQEEKLIGDKHCTFKGNKSGHRLDRELWKYTEGLCQLRFLLSKNIGVLDWYQCKPAAQMWGGYGSGDTCVSQLLWRVETVAQMVPMWACCSDERWLGLRWYLCWTDGWRLWLRWYLCEPDALMGGDLGSGGTCAELIGGDCGSGGTYVCLLLWCEVTVDQMVSYVSQLLWWVETMAQVVPVWASSSDGRWLWLRW